MGLEPPVYNGYTEYFLTGVELKQFFKGEYYSTGKHHSTIIDLKIEDFLTIIGIDDDTTYRIFTNEFFCKIWNGPIDHKFTFFGHTKTNNIKYLQTYKDTPLETICPHCGSTMKLRVSKFGEFLGCSSYPNCKYIINIPIIGNYQKENKEG